MLARRAVRRLTAATLGALTLGLVGLSVPAQGATLNVTDEASLRAALTNAANGDVIEFSGAPGTITLTQDLPVLDADVTVNGNDWMINGDDHRGFVIDGTEVTFDGIKFDEALEFAFLGQNDAHLTITNSQLRGINIPGGPVTAFDTGAIKLADGSDLDLAGSFLNANTTGVTSEELMDSTINISNTLLRAHTLAVSAPVGSNGSLTISNSEFRDNNTAIWSYGQAGSTATITDTDIFNSITGLRVSSVGDAVIDVRDSTIAYSEDAGVTFTFASAGQLNFTDSAIDWNSIGVMHNVSGTAMTFTRTSLSNNLYAAIGGQADGHTTLTDSTLSHNGASSSTQDLRASGAIVLHGGGGLDILRSTFDGNYVQDINAGHINGYFGPVNIEDSTFTGLVGQGTSAPEQSISVTNSSLHMRHSTVTGNDAGTLARVVHLAGTTNATISHSIVTGGQSAFDVEDPATASVDWSMLGGPSTGSVTEGGGVVDGVIDPQLGPLADNGGLTQTRLPLTGSPAIDAGNPSVSGAPSIDQRGLNRISGSAIDIGAVEVQGPATQAPTVTDPSDTSVAAGETATFTVLYYGVPEPTVTWEVSTDDGDTWNPVTAAEGTVSADHRVLTTVATTVDDNGNQYRVHVSNTAGSDTSEPATLTVTAATSAPTITDPTDVTVTAGEDATFTVTAGGVPAPTVTWEVSVDNGPWTDVAGATGPTLTVPTTTDDDGNRYRATATNSEGDATSQPATLTVNPATSAPTITDPVDATVAPGEQATFSVSVTGTPAPTLMWEVSTDDGDTWETIAGETGLVLQVTAAEDDDGKQYRATATNTEGTATSDAATLTVNPANATPTITDPTDVTVTAGEDATFTVAANGVPTPTVTWEVSVDGGPWTAVAGATGPTLTVPTTADDDGNRYRATASNSEGDVTSDAATLTVNPAPVAPTVSDPSDATVVEGETAVFSVTADGTPDPTVTWQVSTDGGNSWDSITSNAPVTTLAVDSSLRIVTTTDDDGNLYRAVATSNAGTTTSAAATLTVTPAGGTDPDDGSGPGSGTDPDTGDGTTPTAGPGLPDAGSDVPLLVPVAGVMALLLGCTLLLGHAMVQRRRSV